MNGPQQPLYVRVTKDGSDTKYELILDRVKVRDLTQGQLVEIIMQFTSCLRY